MTVVHTIYDQSDIGRSPWPGPQQLPGASTFHITTGWDLFQPRQGLDFEVLPPEYNTCNTVTPQVKEAE